ncbi:MAG: hypothetical protein NT020_12555, partial [Chloroflexales bacterium]|nr:hypothetical protein [Chloroflexales bacterium]
MGDLTLMPRKFKMFDDHLQADRWRTGRITIKAKDIDQVNTFFGDRPLDNPGYSEFSLKGAVGVNQANDRLDVARVEQRLKYLGFPAIFNDQEERALRAFYASTHYRYNSSSLSNGIQHATSSDAKLVSPGGTGDTNLAWLNAFNAPHWVNVYEKFGIPINGQQGNFSNGQETREIYATSWSADLISGWDNYKNSQGLTTGRLQINGLTDPAYLFPTHGKGGHSVGMGLDLGFGQNYISPTYQTPAYDQAAPQPQQMVGTGWSIQNALTWATLLNTG